MLVRSESVKVGLWVHTIHGLTAHGSVGVQSSMAAIAEPCDWPTLSPSLVYRPGVSLSSRTHSAGVVLFINAMGPHRIILGATEAKTRVVLKLARRCTRERTTQKDRTSSGKRFRAQKS